jgi:hypothetical protein
MQMALTRFMLMLAVLAVVLSAGGACGGHPCPPADGTLEPGTPGTPPAGDASAALDGTTTAPEDGEAEDTAEQPQADKNPRPDGAVEPENGAAEKTGPPMSMLDVFRGLKVGDWVRTRWSNKEEHTLLVAARTEETITIEEIVEDRGFRKSWTQMDVSLEDGGLLGLRQRSPEGTIEELEPTPDAQRGTSDLLTQRFRRDGTDDEIRINRIEVYRAGAAEPEIKRGLFLCRRYKITVEKGRWARLWFSKVKLPDYPVRISYPEESLRIDLQAFGSGGESTFNEKQ